MPDLAIVYLLSVLLGNAVANIPFVDLNSGTYTSPNNKLNVGSYCVKTSDTSISLHMRIHENDEDFKYVDEDGTELGTVKYVCELRSATDGDSNDNVPIADKSSCPAGSATFTRVETTSPTDGNVVNIAQYRTHEIIVPLATFNQANIGTIACGGKQNGKDMTYFATCHRYAGFDSWSDVYAKFSFDFEKCISSTVDFGNIKVGNPSQTNLERQYEVTLNAYKSPTHRYRDDLNTEFNTAGTQQSPDAQKIDGSGVALGDSIYLEACIKTNDNRLYFVDEVSYLGITVKKCVAEPGPTATDYLDGVAAVDISNDAGCGLGAEPAKQWTNTKRAFTYGRGGTVADKPFFSSPNCFRSEIFEAVSFARKDISALSTIVFKCDVAYCNTVGDKDCFGTDAGGTVAYPTCPATARRRRSENVGTDELPSTLLTTVTVRVEAQSKDPLVVENCFDESTFFGLIGVLGTIILVLLTSGIWMGVRMKNIDHLKSLSSGRTSSTFTT